MVERAGTISPAAYMPYDVNLVRDLGTELRAASADDRTAAQLLSNTCAAAVRLGGIDELGFANIIDTQYVDDLAAPASSSEQVDAIWAGC